MNKSMSDIKEQTIVKVGKRYTGFKCKECGKLITRKIYAHHIERTKDFFCSLSCSNKNGKLKDINDYDDWVYDYKTDAPKYCQKNMKIESCLECKAEKCNNSGGYK